MNLNTIFFIGPQGSGKGTQAKLLAKKLDFFYWEMSTQIRKTKEKDPFFGKKVQSMIDQGILLPDEMIEKIISLFLTEIPAEKGIIFDGVPRRVGQAEFIFKLLKEQGRKKFLTLFINLPKEDSTKRLLKRAETEHRPDDTREKIIFRLKQYEEDTLPVLDFLKQNSTFFEIDGTPNVETIQQKIVEDLGI